MEKDVRTMATTVRLDMRHLATLLNHLEKHQVKVHNISDLIRVGINTLNDILNKSNPDLKVVSTFDAARVLKSRNLMNPFDKDRPNYSNFVKQLADEEQSIINKDSVSSAIDAIMKRKKETDKIAIEDFDLSQIPDLDTAD